MLHDPIYCAVRPFGKNPRHKRDHRRPPAERTGKPPIKPTPYAVARRLAGHVLRGFCLVDCPTCKEHEGLILRAGSMDTVIVERVACSCSRRDILKAWRFGGRLGNRPAQMWSFIGPF